MSRVAKKPVNLPQGVTVTVDAGSVTVKGAKGTLSLPLAEGVLVEQADQAINVKLAEGAAAQAAKAGSTRAHLANMVEGVTKGFERKLELVGVGYRASVQGKSLNLTLGFSHPVVYPVPEGIEIATPTQTEILVKGINRQQVGQVAAEIRAYRSPEPYKGKGVRYSGERIELKEAKKK
jgi:large subunit ribosomal protein L6